MNPVLKGALFAIAGGAGVAGATIAAAPHVVESEWGQSRVAGFLESRLGRAVSFSDLDVDLGRVLRLRLADLRIENPDWATRPLFASASSIEVGVQAAPLLRGRLHVVALRLQQPHVNLERSRAGQVNWGLGPAGDGGSGGPNLTGIDALELQGARLAYLDPARSTDLGLSLQATTRPDPGRVDIEARGTGRLLGEPVRIEASGAAPLTADLAAARMPIALRVESGDALATASGEVGPMIVPGAHGEVARIAALAVSVNGESLARVNPLFGTAFGSESYSLSAHLHLDRQLDGHRAVILDVLSANALDSDLAGKLTVRETDAGAEVVAVLHSERLNMQAIAEGLSAASEVTPPVAGDEEVPTDWRQTGVPASVVQALASTGLGGTLRYRAREVNTGAGALRDVRLELSLNDGVVELREALARTGKGTAMATARLAARATPVQGEVRITLDATPLRVLLAQRESFTSDVDVEPLHPVMRSGVLDGELGVAFTASAAAIDGAKAADTLALRAVDLRAAHLRLRANDADDAADGVGTELTLRVTPGPLTQARELLVEGTFNGAPVALDARLPPMDVFMAAAGEGGDVLPVAATLRIGATSVEVSGDMTPGLPPRSVDVDLSVQSESPSTTAALLGYPLPELSRFSLDARLVKSAARWRLTEFASTLGQSDLAGTLRLTLGDQAAFEADLRSTRVDLASLIGGEAMAATTPSPGATLPVNPPAWIADLAGKLRWRVDSLRVGDTRIEDIDLNARIDEGTVQLARTGIAHAGGRIVVSGQLDLAAPGMAGRVDAAASGLEMTRLVGNAAGAADPKPAYAGSVDAEASLRLPEAARGGGERSLLDRLRIDTLRARYDDPDRRTRSDLQLVADSMNVPMRVEGTVEVDGVPVQVRLVSGSLRDALRDFQSLPVDATVHLVETTLEIDSRIDRLLPLETLSASVYLAGPDPARLGEALSLPLPSLPPYRIRAQLDRTRDGNLDRWALSALDGRVGDSDVAGTVQVTVGAERPFVFARLESRTLDLDDLAGIVGAPPDPDETASARQRRRAERLEGAARLLPSRPVRFQNMRLVDADVSLRATRVTSPRLPVDDLVVVLALENGLLDVAQLDFGVAGGTIALTLQADARKDPLQGKITGDVNRVHLGRILEGEENADDTSGIVGGRLALWMRGDSLATWLASADGGLFLTMTGGTLDTLLVELAGLDFVESAAAFLGGESKVTIDCAYADLQARGGTVTVAPLLVDTSDTKFEGSGTIDLRDERLDLIVNPYPKDFTLLSSRGPLEVKGTLKAPRFEVNPSFPTPEFGLAEDAARCSGLIEALREARKSG